MENEHPHPHTTRKKDFIRPYIDLPSRTKVKTEPQRTPTRNFSPALKRLPPISAYLYTKIVE